MATYDPDGTLIDERSRALYVNGAARGGKKQQLGWLIDGGALWEWLHPGQVQDEYRAVGSQTIPDKSEIRGEAVDRMISTARADAAGGASGGMSLMRLAVLGLVAFAVIEVARVLPAPRGKSLRAHYTKRARRAIAKRIAG